MEIIKKIGLTVWKISLVWLICVYIHFLLYMVFNLDWHFINAAVPATVGIAISIVGYFAIAGFKNLCKMRREKTKGIALWIFAANLFAIQIFIFSFGKEIINSEILHPAVINLLPAIWLGFITVLFVFYEYLSNWYIEQEKEEYKKFEEEDLVVG